MDQQTQNLRIGNRASGSDHKALTIASDIHRIDKMKMSLLLPWRRIAMGGNLEGVFRVINDV